MWYNVEVTLGYKDSQASVGENSEERGKYLMKNANTINICDYAEICDINLSLERRLGTAFKLYNERRNTDGTQEFAPVSLPRDVYNRMYLVVDVGDLDRLNILVAGTEAESCS